MSWWLRADLQRGETAACWYPSGNAAGFAECLAQRLACGRHAIHEGFHRCPHTP